jgi:hypothetical protein
MHVKRLTICLAAIASLVAGLPVASVIAVFHASAHRDFQNPAPFYWNVGGNYAGTGVLQVTPYLASTDPTGFYACVGLGSSGAQSPYSYNCYYGSGYGPYGSGNIQTMYMNSEPYTINWIHGIDYSIWN